MTLNITRIIRRFRELTDVITTALTAGNTGKSMAMTWDNSGQTLTLTKDPSFDSATINNTTASTSTTTGALVVGNSVGIGGGNVNAAGRIISSERVTAPFISGALIKQSRAFEAAFGASNALGMTAERLLGAPALFTVTSTGFSNVDNLFDGSYSTDAIVPSVTTATLEIDFNPYLGYIAGTSTGGYGYGNGKFVFYPVSGQWTRWRIEIQRWDGTADVWVLAGEVTAPSGFTNNRPLVIDFSTFVNRVRRVRFEFDTGLPNSRARLLEYYPSDPGIIGTTQPLGELFNYPLNRSLAEQICFVPALGVTNNGQTATSRLTPTHVSTGAVRPTTNSTTAVRVQNANGTTTLQNFDTTNNRVGHPVFSSFSAGAQFGSDAPDFGGGEGAIIGIDNAATAPTTNPIDGVVVYAEGGAFRVRNASGNIGQVVHDGAQSFSGVKTFTDSPAISRSAGVAGQLNFATNGVLRWQIEKTAAAETGGNAGSNLIVNRYDDGGGYTGTFLQLFRDTGKLEVYAETEFTSVLRIPQGTPASASAPGARGQIVHDADYIYICVASDTWKRTALTTW